MVNPVLEIRDFLHAALLRQVPRDHEESNEAFQRRRLIALATLVIGAGTLAFALRIQPGDPLFYPATFALGAVWLVGGLLSGPLHLGRAHTRAGQRHARPIVQPLALGAFMLALFLAGALVVGRVPVLRDPVLQLLDHARLGSIQIVLVITIVNGIAEEIYFRGALYAGVGRRYPVTVTTAIYTLVTAAAGIPLLAFAAMLIGIVTGLQRRVTGGILAPTITHLTWSVGMLFLLRPVLDFAA